MSTRSADGTGQTSSGDVAWARGKPARAANRVILGGVLRPLVAFYGHPQTAGVENLEGLEPPFILCANHSSHMDTPLVLLALPKRLRRRTLVAAAADYFFSNRLKGGLTALAVGAVPIERRRPTRETMERVRRLLGEGWALLVYPEGTRTPDGRLYRGKTGVARIALEGGFPVVPVGVKGTFEAFPADRRMPRRAEVEVRFGKPIRFERYRDRPMDQFVLRSVTDEIMYEIMLLTGQEYVDEYSRRERPALEPNQIAAPEGPPIEAKREIQASSS